MRERKVVTIFEADRFWLAKGLFKLAQQEVIDSFEWKRLMNFRQILISGNQIVELTTFRIQALLEAMAALDKSGKMHQTLRTKKKLEMGA